MPRPSTTTIAAALASSLVRRGLAALGIGVCRCGLALAVGCALDAYRCKLPLKPNRSSPDVGTAPGAEIYFNRSHSICGALIHTYLLEKSRVVHQQPDERSYHIFYQVGAGRGGHRQSLRLVEAGSRHTQQPGSANH